MNFRELMVKSESYTNKYKYIFIHYLFNNNINNNNNMEAIDGIDKKKEKKEQKQRNKNK